MKHTDYIQADNEPITVRGVLCPNSKTIKPISYFKANAAKMLKELRETGQPYVITRNGEAAAVLMDAREYDKLQKTLQLMRLVAKSEEQVQLGKTVPLESVMSEIRERSKNRRV